MPIELWPRSAHWWTRDVEDIELPASRLDVQVQAPNVITPSSEEALSTWMHDHLSVAVCPIDDRDALEALSVKCSSG